MRFNPCSFRLIHGLWGWLLAAKHCPSPPNVPWLTDAGDGAVYNPGALMLQYNALGFRQCISTAMEILVRMLLLTSSTRLFSHLFHTRFVTVALVLIVSGLAGCGQQSANNSQSHSSGAAHGDHTAAATSATPRIPAHFESAAAAQPLPAVLDPKRFSNPIVARGYQMAAANSAVFAQQPCYCYCDAGESHKSLLDCYASEHSAGCDICLREGYYVDKMTKAGKSAAEIRKLIIDKEWQKTSLE